MINSIASLLEKNTGADPKAPLVFRKHQPDKPANSEGTTA
jgi:hypothetical protein